MALVLAASPPNLPESTRHDRRSGPRRHRPLLAEDLPRRRSVRARADRGDQRLAPPCPRNARLCRSANPRPVRRPRVIHKHATPAVPRGAAEPQIPIAPPRRRTLTVPRFPPLEAFGRRPSGPHLRPRQGRHPKPYEEAGIHWRRRERGFVRPEADLHPKSPIPPCRENADLCGVASTHERAPSDSRDLSCKGFEPAGGVTIDLPIDGNGQRRVGDKLDQPTRFDMPLHKLDRIHAPSHA